MKRKTKSIILIVAMTLAILLLATAVTASLTNGFKNSNPYGWLENFDRIKKDTELNGFEVCKDFELDFAKLIKGVKATEDTENVSGTTKKNSLKISRCRGNIQNEYKKRSSPQKFNFCNVHRYGFLGFFMLII